MGWVWQRTVGVSQMLARGDRNVQTVIDYFIFFFSFFYIVLSSFICKYKNFPQLFTICVVKGKERGS